MPKLKKKILTATVYVYVKPVNKLFAYKKADRLGLSYSEYVDRLFERERYTTQRKHVARAA